MWLVVLMLAKFLLVSQQGRGKEKKSQSSIHSSSSLAPSLWLSAAGWGVLLKTFAGAAARVSRFFFFFFFVQSKLSQGRQSTAVFPAHRAASLKVKNKSAMLQIASCPPGLQQRPVHGGCQPGLDPRQGCSLLPCMVLLTLHGMFSRQSSSRAVDTERRAPRHF